jgi:hypothetical protein
MGNLKVTLGQVNMGSLKVVYVDIKDLRAAEYNPRQMTEKQAADLEQSIRRFGMVDPLVVNRHPERLNVYSRYIRIVERKSLQELVFGLC